MKHELVSWQGLELLVRPDTVDLDNLNWMADSPFWRAFTAANIRPEDHVFDFGAHIGAFALLATAHCGCRVFAVEPHYDSFRLHCANMYINGVQNEQTVVNGAIGGKDGKAVLYEHMLNWAHTTLEGGSDPDWLTGVKCEVPCWSLASCFDLAQAQDCAFMKLNVEGAEFEFIESAAVPDLRRIKSIVAELHFDRARVHSKERFIEKIKSADFELQLEYMREDRAFMFASRSPHSETLPPRILQA